MELPPIILAKQELSVHSFKEIFDSGPEGEKQQANFTDKTPEEKKYSKAVR